MLHVKSHVQRFLRHCGVYHRLKTSVVYDAYWWIANPQLVRDSRAEARFYHSVLEGFQPGDLVFDVGANEGRKTRIFLQMGARVLAVEPDSRNQHVLRESFLRLRLTSQPVTIVPAALSDSSGTEVMWIEEPGSAKNTLSRKWVELLRHDDQRFGQVSQFRHKTDVQTTTLDSLVLEHGLPFFVKIDVEGAELRVIRGLTQPVPYISFEVNLPEFLDEGLECVSRLEELKADGAFNYVVSCVSGLAFQRWMPAREFAPRLRACTETSVEVFWRAADRSPLVNDNHPI